MPKVTGITAAKAQQIVNDNIVDGHVSGNDLILLTRSGQTINAGNVRGIAGPAGPPNVADDISYDNTTSELDAATIQQAIDVLAGLIGTADLSEVTEAIAGIESELSGKMPYNFRTWDGDEWSPRPDLPEGIPALASSAWDIDCTTPPPDGEDGDIWWFHKDAAVD